MSESIALVWFESDLRLRDNPALTHATDKHDTVIPVYIRDTDEESIDGWPDGGGTRWWTGRSLQALERDLWDHDLELVMRRGPAAETLEALIEESGAHAVYWNRRARPGRAERDRTLKWDIGDDVELQTFEAQLMHDPEAVETTSGGPYHVYTPFWKKFLKVVEVADPLPKPPLETLEPPEAWPESEPLEELGLTDKDHPWPKSETVEQRWTPGEAAARQQLESFLDEHLADYGTLRDRPDLDATSKLSAHLRSGELSPRQVWHAARDSEAADSREATEDVETYLQEIVWREFAYHMLHHYPETTDEPLKEKFRGFDWHDAPEALQRWKEGQTGYPIVDAGMRQLTQTGWMHNRVRMVVASFLTKDLLIPWQRGAEWFWEMLVDADLANNTMGWQWAAGCGADAQPFFRIFNPVSQGDRHDPEGDYVRRFVPELSDLPDDALHAPWEADESTLSEAGITLGEDYPEPIVDHGAARERALERYEQIK